MPTRGRGVEMRLSKKQVRVLELVRDGKDPCAGVELTHNGFLGRMHTLRSLVKLGLVVRGPGREWVLTEAGKEEVGRRPAMKKEVKGSMIDAATGGVREGLGALVVRMIDLKRELRRWEKTRDGCIAVNGNDWSETVVDKELHAKAVGRVREIEAQITLLESEIDGRGR